MMYSPIEKRNVNIKSIIFTNVAGFGIDGELPTHNDIRLRNDGEK